MPDCAARPSDCADLDALNVLDGFNLTPRLSIPFDGTIDVATATSRNIFLVSLGSTLPDGGPVDHRTGIDQVVWDTASTTLHVESDQLLDQHTRYVLVVTKDVRDHEGKAIKAAGEFLNFIDPMIIESTGDRALDAYRGELRAALADLDERGIVARGQVVVASVFTTLSASASLERIRDQIKAIAPEPVDFLLGLDGSRTVFPRTALASLRHHQQRSATASDPLFSVPLQFQVLNIVPGAVGSIAFGKFRSPEYRILPDGHIPVTGTRTGSPIVQGQTDIRFILCLPASARPPAGYPVAIFGHGGGSNKATSGWLAAKFAQHGIATIAIDAPGFGHGPLSRYAVTLTNGSTVTLLSGGRSIDVNSDGVIEDPEGSGSGGSWQWQADHMQLVREIQMGVDVEGDGVADLDPSRIYFTGISMGGRLGTVLLALEPSVRAGVINVPGITGGGWLSPGRGDIGATLQLRIPSLINFPGIVSIDGLGEAAPFFNENMPLRRDAPYSATWEDGLTYTVRSPVVSGVAGAMEIQQLRERSEWANQSTSSVVYASYLRRRPLPGVPAKPVIIQFPLGDRSVANPETVFLLDAGALADRATFLRTDLAFGADQTKWPKPFGAGSNLYPHTFMQIYSLPQDPALAKALNDIALRAEDQIASFFELDGPGRILEPFDQTQIIDPDGAGPIFEVPIGLPLPLRLNYPLSSTLPAVLQQLLVPELRWEPCGNSPDGRVTFLSARPLIQVHDAPGGRYRARRDAVPTGVWPCAHHPRP